MSFLNTFFLSTLDGLYYVFLIKHIHGVNFQYLKEFRKQINLINISTGEDNNNY